MAKEKASQEKKADAEVNLEAALKRLEEIVTDLEKSDLSLEKSLGIFEEGVVLSRKCHDLLSSAEKKIQILSKVSSTGPEIEDYK